MAATLPINDQAVYLGNAAGSSGTYVVNVYTTVAGKVGFIELLSLAYDSTGNNTLSTKISSCWKNVSGTATQVGVSNTIGSQIGSASFAGSTTAYAANGASVKTTFTNAGTNAADIAFFVQTWDAA